MEHVSHHPACAHARLTRLSGNAYQLNWLRKNFAAFLKCYELLLMQNKNNRLTKRSLQKGHWNDTQQARHSPPCSTAYMQGSDACGKIFAAEIASQTSSNYCSGSNRKLCNDLQQTENPQIRQRLLCFRNKWSILSRF